jgi:hypothetical protein
MMEKLVEWLAGETELLGENLPQCRVVHHKPHMLPGRKPVGSQRLTTWATAQPFELLKSACIQECDAFKVPNNTWLKRKIVSLWPMPCVKSMKKNTKICQIKTGCSVTDVNNGGRKLAQCTSKGILHMTVSKLKELCKFTSLNYHTLFANISGKSAYLPLLWNFFKIKYMW